MWELSVRVRDLSVRELSVTASMEVDVTEFDRLRQYMRYYSTTCSVRRAYFLNEVLEPSRTIFPHGVGEIGLRSGGSGSHPTYVSIPNTTGTIYQSLVEKDYKTYREVKMPHFLPRKMM